VCRPKHVEQLRNIGIINSIRRLHLVGLSASFIFHLLLDQYLRNFLSLSDFVNIGDVFVFLFVCLFGDWMK
jgi:hypothetical protein